MIFTDLPYCHVAIHYSMCRKLQFYMEIHVKFFHRRISSLTFSVLMSLVLTIMQDIRNYVYKCIFARSWNNVFFAPGKYI